MKLRRSRENVVIAGILGGLGESFNVDPTILRIGFVILVFLDVSILIPLYIIGSIIIPKAKRKDKKIDKAPIEQHNMDNLSEINEEDWSDF